MSESPREEDFPGGTHDPALSRLYREMAREVPPEELDRTIRTAAHQALGRGSWLAWGMRAGAAAMVLVLGVGVSLRVFDTGPMQLPTGDTEPVPAQLRAPGSVPGDRPLKSAPAEERLDRSRPRAVESELDAAAFPRPSTSFQFEQNLSKRKIAVPEAAARHDGIEEPACEADVPLQAANRAAWLERIAELQLSGEQARAACLERLFRKRFDDNQP